MDANPAGQDARRLRLGFFGSRNKAGIIIAVALIGGLAVGLLSVVIAVVVLFI